MALNEQCRIYFVVYSIIGRDKELLSRTEAYVLAVDADDIIKQIKEECLGIEINIKDEETDELTHFVAEDVDFESIELVGTLRGLTEQAVEILSRITDPLNLEGLRDGSQDDDG